jgi:MATE family multidrug resistance protein
MQVAQTAERMKRWGGGGQDIDTDQKKEEINYP